MGRAVNAESMLTIVPSADALGPGVVAMRLLLRAPRAPWAVPACAWSSAVHRHGRGALAKVR